MATEQQIPKLAASIVEHQSVFATLSVDDAQWAIMNAREAATLLCKAIQTRVVNLIQTVGEVAFPGATNFVVSEKLGVDKSETATVKISGYGSNFATWFLGKVETNVAPSRLGYGKLLRRAKAAVIRAFLGGEATAETSLAEIHHLITLQPNGEEGALLTNGWANIFFVRDKDHVLRLVYVDWDGGGWSWRADELSREGEWYDGRQVFSRKTA